MTTQSSTAQPRHRSAAEKPQRTQSNGSEVDSGYVSASSSTGSLPQVILTKPQVKHLNEQLEGMHPMDILRFARVAFPNLYQTTAFGLTGLVTIDMLSKIEHEERQPGSTKKPGQTVELIFLDTLFHFNETYDLVNRVRERYPNVPLHVFRPDGVNTVAEFEERYGERLYEMAEELYDWIAKVEPQQRAYDELRVAAVLTGRRRSQGGARGSIPVIEVDDERGVIKINPLASWSFTEVDSYVRKHNVPYNVLLDRGYKSIGDWHSTSPVAAGEDERAGRWKGKSKTECGIHNKKSRYAQFLEESERKAREEKLAAALDKVEDAQQQQPVQVQ